MESTIYKEISSGDFCYVSELNDEDYAVYTCKENGADEQQFLINDGNGIKDSYESFESAQFALDSFAKEGSLIPLSDEEMNTFLSIFTPPDDDPEAESEEPDLDIECDDMGNENDGQSNEDGDPDNESCEWENASGDPEHEPEQEDEGLGEESEDISGDRLSLRSSDFNEIIDTADTALNKLVSTLHEKKQRDGEMTMKISFEEQPDGHFTFSGAVSGKINYAIKPQKVSGNDVEIKFDAFGNPIIPFDRQRQLTFDDEEISSATVTTDSNGVVESVDFNDQTAEGMKEEQSDTCDKAGCPYYTFDENWDGMCSISSDTALKYDESYKNVRQAIEDHGCLRLKVAAAYEQFAREEIAMEEVAELHEIQPVDESLEHEELNQDLYNYYDNGGEPA